MILAMLSRAAFPRRVSRILCCRKKWSEQGFPWGNARGPYSSYEQASPPALVYAVRRGDPVLVGPVSQTPRETKRLSDLDDIDSARLHLSLALFYRGRPGAVDPALVIRRALGEALVHYYPMAGRLREIEGRKLVVDCTGEGVLFVEAEADVRLADMEAAGLRPPVPCWDQLLFDVEGSSGVLNCPLLLVQVTRLLCGGFVLALRFSHTICDGIGIAQFLTAVSEFACGLPSTTVTPVWSRDLIKARDPPPSFFQHRELNVFPPPPPAGGGDMILRSFTFTASDVVAIKKSLPPVLRDTATTFEALAASIWLARATALEIPPGEDASLCIAVNFRGDAGMSLPAGYYGNAIVFSTIQVAAAALRDGSLGDAVALVRLAKASITTQYVRSMVDEVVMLGRRWLVPDNMFAISDARRLGFHRVDFGWGQPVFAGPVVSVFGGSFLLAVTDPDGQDAVAVPVMLPELAMDRFTAQLQRLIS